MKTTQENIALKIDTLDRDIAYFNSQARASFAKAATYAGEYAGVAENLDQRIWLTNWVKHHSEEAEKAMAKAREARAAKEMLEKILAE